jgi:hypothetical protein
MSYKQKYHYVIKTAKATSIHNTTASSYNITKILWNVVTEEKRKTEAMGKISSSRA